MNKTEINRIYNYLTINQGYSKDFAELCIDSIVSEERVIGEVVGFLEEIYNSRMSEVEETSEGMKDFVSYCVKERLSTMSPTFCDDEYFTTGLNWITYSYLEQTIFAVHTVYDEILVMFDDEKDAPTENSVFGPLSTYLIYHHSVCDKIIKAIEDFDWRKETNNERKPKNTEVETDIKSMGAYNVAVRWLKDNRDNENYNKVSTLVGQYHYGVSVHRELEDCLESLGIKFDKRV